MDISYSNIDGVENCQMNGQPVSCSDPAFVSAMNIVKEISEVAGIVVGLVGVLMLASMWQIFKKAGKPGWAILIPFYNMVVLLEITRNPIWWIILMFIPFVNIGLMIYLSYQLAHRFGKSGAFFVGLIILPFIFYPILGFGKAQYIQS